MSGIHKIRRPPHYRPQQSEHPATIGQIAPTFDKHGNDEQPGIRRKSNYDHKLEIWRDLAIELMAQREIIDDWIKVGGGELPKLESLKCNCGWHQRVKGDLYAQVRRLQGKKDGKAKIGQSWQAGHEQETA
jgi:hypothetical protein